MERLVERAAHELAPSAGALLRQTAIDSIRAFYEGLGKAAEVGDNIPLHAILLDWVEARSAPTEEEPTGLLPVLATLKRVTWDEVMSSVPPQDALEILRESEGILTDAVIFLGRMEGEALLGDMRRELERAKREIEHLDKSKSNFVSVAAHELKTPLTLIEGYTDMLRSSLGSDDSSHLQPMLSGIYKGIKRLREIIEDMLDVSQIDTGMLTLHMQPVWLRRLLELAEFELEEAIIERKQTLTVDYETIPARPTMADYERLYQVFFKVLSNAIKYTPDGGSITVRGRELPGFVDVMVSDTGIGIAPENLQRIFDKFSSIGDIATHSSGKIKFKGGGPGLGLAIAKGIIEAHGGTIWAESPGYDEEKCPGSTFHIMIPMNAPPPGDHLASIFEADDDDDGGKRPGRAGPDADRHDNFD